MAEHVLQALHAQLAVQALHAPCNSCFSRRTHERNRKIDGGACCPLVRCPNAGCSFEPHACQVEDHASLVCLFQRVPCVNACNGCAWELRRGDMHVHLQTCPASVIRCMAEWNRWSISDPLDSTVSAQSAEDDDLCSASNPTDDWTIMRSSAAATGSSRHAIGRDSRDYLDVALMNRDQRVLDASRSIPLKLKSALRNNINRKYPAAPVEIPLIWGANENAAAQSSLATVSSGECFHLICENRYH